MSLHVADSYVYQSQRQRSGVPTDRFTGLLKGICLRNGTELDLESLRRGAQYSFLELCTEALKDRPLAADTDLILCTNASLEYDPAQSGAGAAFMARFGRYEMHAISNEGILGGFTALEIARKILLQQDRKICLMALEQNTNPVPVDYRGFVPTENILALLDLRQGGKAGTPQILAAGVVHERGLTKKLEVLCARHGLAKENVTLWLADAAHAEKLAGGLHSTKVVTYDFLPSAAQPLQCLQKMLQESREPFSLLLIEDVFTRNFGFLLIGKEQS